MSGSDRYVVVCGGFDNMRSPQVRFLQEAARLGRLRVSLWSDEAIYTMTGAQPTFPQAERLYYLQALRYVDTVHVATAPPDADTPPSIPNVRPEVWVVHERDHTPAKQAICREQGLEYRVLTETDLAGFPDDVRDARAPRPSRKKVLVTGCYDWFHTGHIRFFEECSELGDLYVVVGHDANIRLLKGEGHPMFSQQKRRYLVQSIRYVAEALISTGDGWLDAEPEIERIGPDIYVVNEDGDKPEKRDYCADHGIEYVVLQRLPKPGLPRRESTHLRGF
jgi:cytidyltransferase-like protein